ncbi:threonine-phosphate decarboxylase CobD [Azospirillum sp.]|uniref:threonine-phosphate decarboxylase CobD n=1 Tax=Azospirillum sp. TaxID=34012 RepID=UPI003D75A3C2
MAETTGGTKGQVLHGGDLDAARAAYPTAPEPWIDLSTGINPWPYPLPAISDTAWTRLPGRGEEESLRAAAAAYYGAPSAAHAAAAPGSQALIQLLPRLRAPGRVSVLGPTYAEHARAWAVAGHTVRTVGRLEDLDGDVAVIVNPNNPDGRVVGRADLFALAERFAARGGWLVVDEAFADVVPEAGITDAVDRPGLVVLRSFGKFFGLAGVRLGVALAAEPLAAAIRDAVGPWAVPGPTLAIATQAFQDGAWIAATRRRLSAEAAGLDGALAGLGFTVIGGTPLYRLARHTFATPILNALGRAGVLVRRFEDHPEWLRFGLPPDDDAQRRFVSAVQDVVDK